ncbi:DUF29 domain-containing protein [[Limnothrix rosea] IAM M-220]|uniref:DUF29 domain-containing protein n=1 Tax=[Limnothrix rosea] IAM M-220 TaxID=454133 RepID=UPI000960BAE3|nr:DUF29 domain-containing protein [[Limnothrix rosea] IAM M-220]OKH19779.1 hypothetical protein NIES208_01235 [[Limnothrix rosea] IAM M-220]
MNVITYEDDFHAWTQQQAELLRNQDFSDLDWSNIAEEIESMGRSEKRQLESRLEVLMMHMLKWQYQPNRQSRSWQFTIKEQRLRIEKLLSENPSLRSQLQQYVEKSYPLAVLRAERETGLSDFPVECPFELEEVLEKSYEII